eukprot:1667272-Prymnesium_polylepis.1
MVANSSANGRGTVSDCATTSFGPQKYVATAHRKIGWSVWRSVCLLTALQSRNSVNHRASSHTHSSTITSTQTHNHKQSSHRRLQRCTHA